MPLSIQERNAIGAANIAPYRVKPGEVRNPKGKPKQKVTLKDFVELHRLIRENEVQTKIINALLVDVADLREKYNALVALCAARQTDNQLKGEDNHAENYKPDIAF